MVQLDFSLIMGKTCLERDHVRKKWYFLIFIIIILANVSTTTAAAAGDLPDDAEMQERLWLVEQFVSRQFERNDLIGGIYGIIHQDTLIHEQAYGTTSKQAQITPDATTRYAVASVTKALTATAIYKLQEEGLLDVDKSVRTYIPGFRFQGEDDVNPVTLRHLLTHSAGGVGSQTDAQLFEHDARNSLADYVEVMKQIELTEQPGTTGNYCNGCFDLLGHVIEQVTDLSYYDYMEQSIFEPLGMHATIYGEQLDTIPASKVADEYHWFFTRKIQLGRNFESFGTSQDPDGGAYSTLEDLVKYVAFQLGYGEQNLLRADSTLDARAPFVPTEAGDAYYTASGFEVKHWHGTDIYWKFGDGMGSGSAVLFIPEYELGLVLLYGEFYPFIQTPIIEGMASILMGYEPIVPEPTAPIGKISWIAIAIATIGLLLLSILARAWKRRERSYAKPLWRSVAASILWGGISAGIGYVLLFLRPSGMGFYGFPYDAALGLILFVTVSILIFLYNLYILLSRRSNNHSAAGKP